MHLAGTAVLISDDGWRAIQETMYLLSVPGMRESIVEGLATPLEECSDEVEW
jgi:antitoxin YefM